jgi:hypothetical protein
LFDAYTSQGQSLLERLEVVLENQSAAAEKSGLIIEWYDDGALQRDLVSDKFVSEVFKRSSIFEWFCAREPAGADRVTTYTFHSRKQSWASWLTSHLPRLLSR